MHCSMVWAQGRVPGAQADNMRSVTISGMIGREGRCVFRVLGSSVFEFWKRKRGPWAQSDRVQSDATFGRLGVVTV